MQKGHYDEPERGMRRKGRKKKYGNDWEAVESPRKARRYCPDSEFQTRPADALVAEALEDFEEYWYWHYQVVADYAREKQQEYEEEQRLIKQQQRKQQRAAKRK